MLKLNIKCKLKLTETVTIVLNEDPLCLGVGGLHSKNPPINESQRQNLMGLNCNKGRSIQSTESRNKRDQKGLNPILGFYVDEIVTIQ